MELIDHLVLAVNKGGHGFQRRDIYGGGGTYIELLERVHHFDHGRLQGTLTHSIHVPALQLQRELLLAQYWTGRQWKRQPEPRSTWKPLAHGITTGEPDLTLSLLEVVRVFGGEQISIDFRSTT
jgi:hypothetical protein